MAELSPKYDAGKVYWITGATLNELISRIEEIKPVEGLDGLIEITETKRGREIALATGWELITVSACINGSPSTIQVLGRR